ncbi:hypothetical protein KM176_00040 [Pseudooceanicola sp. CBS1P-1]|uniref:Uncharacterized protein n=1 Tax=Pseudooceanicola albus TaxID=2692189 RepID=A0A6L7FYN3_9RHOB|nr:MULTISPECIES: hypothetical protein [Pseudooceanicola]MBT9382236.1 hypothetical protein [Pseudooceanicola endophyticus]MXN16779.1 hypothetical protein [Pseudooceanicola albus]
MGTTIYSPGIIGNKYTGYLPVITDGLEYLNFFADGADLTRNLAPGKAAASVVGSPVQGEQSITCDSLTN